MHSIDKHKTIHTRWKPCLSWRRERVHFASFLIFCVTSERAGSALVKLVYYRLVYLREYSLHQPWGLSFESGRFAFCWSSTDRYRYREMNARSRLFMCGGGFFSAEQTAAGAVYYICTYSRVETCHTYTTGYYIYYIHCCTYLREQPPKPYTAVHTVFHVCCIPFSRPIPNPAMVYPCL